LISFETSDSLLEEFADELALLDPFPPGNKDVDFEADLREIELFLNRDPSTDFSPKITFDPNPERFTNEPALVCLHPLGDDESSLKKDVQEDECFDPGGKIDKIDAFMDAYNDSEGDVLEILHNTIHNLFPGVFLDQDPRSLKEEPNNDDLMTMDKVKRIENEAKTVRCTVAVRGGRYEVRGGSTRQYEVLFRWRLDQSACDTWHWRVSVRGTVAVSTR
ncbi:hypothetical protein Tco_1487301, partial [Tanacetum coccineum]